MNTKHEQFIGIYENAYSKKYCDSVIEYFDYMVAAGHGYNRQQAEKASKLEKNDTAVFGSGCKVINFKISGQLQSEFNSTFWEVCYPLYVDEFPILKESGNHSSYAFKIQKTDPGQGYHLWHYESSTMENSNRLLVWTLYLNDVKEGGETEFLYQHMRVKPKQGTFVMWPAGFTHAHRGNPPLSNSKYIVTGWVEF